MADPPISVTPPTNPILTASMATFAGPANTRVPESLEKQRKSYLDLDMDEISISAGSSSWLLPPGMRLKGESNYPVWKEAFLDRANGKHLLRHLREDDKVPKEVEDIDDSDPVATKLWQRWSSNDYNMKTMIRINCEKGEPQSLTNRKKKTALAMWQALQAQ